MLATRYRYEVQTDYRSEEWNLKLGRRKGGDPGFAKATYGTCLILFTAP